MKAEKSGEWSLRSKPLNGGRGWGEGPIRLVKGNERVSEGSARGV
jgi:hypothetical protein